METCITKENVLRIIGAFEHAMCDYPFEKDAETAIMRRKDCGKWFAVYFRVPCRTFGEEGGREFALNMKCDPLLARMLREQYSGIAPAYHMNKTHWITVRLDGSVPSAEIEKLLRLAYDLTSPKSCGKVKKM